MPDVADDRAAAYFTLPLIAWQKRHGRHDLPWQNTRDPYRIWLSEIMLQQTQVGSVIPYYARFLERFPTIADLAAAPIEEVLAHWAGLGYYTRARNLHKAAQQIMAQHGGTFPADFDAILALPGIGRSTAAAISAFAFGARQAILDGNVKRVLARFFCIEGDVSGARGERRLWPLAESLLPAQEMEVYTQGVMDLGATLCKPAQPNCAACPVAPGCQARQQGRALEFPQPRERKVLPEKTTQMLLLVHGEHIWLARRPEQGIWGGLLSFLEIDAGADAVAYCRDQLDLRVAPLRAMDRLTHTFTHFKLHITPTVLQVATRQELPGGQWLSLEAALATGIPTPVRKLLDKLRTQLANPELPLAAD
jgi:A/G-specific adenine glycosylase